MPSRRLRAVLPAIRITAIEAGLLPGPAMRLRTLYLFVLLSGFYGGIEARAAKPSEQMEKGSAVTIQSRNRIPLSKMLETVAEKTGNRIAIVDRFGQEDASILARQVKLSMTKVPFWEALRVIQEASDTHFFRLRSGAVELVATGVDSERPDWIIGAGPPTVAGAFLLEPRFDTVTEKHIIALRPEPSLGIPRFLEGRLRVAAGGSQEILVEVKDIQTDVNASTGELDLLFALEDEAGKAFALEPGKEYDLGLEAKLMVPTGRKEVSLPNIPGLLARSKRKPLRVGALALRVTSARREKGFLGSDHFAVTIEVIEGDLDPKDIMLLDAEGNGVKAIGHSTERTGVTRISRFFSLEGIKGPPVHHRLALHVPSQAIPFTLRAAVKLRDHPPVK